MQQSETTSDNVTERRKRLESLVRNPGVSHKTASTAYQALAELKADVEGKGGTLKTGVSWRLLQSAGEKRHIAYCDELVDQIGRAHARRKTNEALELLELLREATKGIELSKLKKGRAAVMYLADAVSGRAPSGSLAGGRLGYSGREIPLSAAVL